MNRGEAVLVETEALTAQDYIEIYGKNKKRKPKKQSLKKLFSLVKRMKRKQK